jgi:hypothetical protein
MPLEKGKFIRLDTGEELEVQFNPTEFTLNKGAQIAEVAIPGLDMPILQFVRGQTETLTLDLFFDTTEGGMGDAARPVTALTDEFYDLVKINPATHAPPVCRFDWGALYFPGDRFGFQCIVESVRQRFTLFNPLGWPLRATLTVSLREYKTLKEQVDEIKFESADHTHAHIVQRGDTLSRIANAVYGDPGRWRPIADHNRLENPLDLRPGAILEIPPLR